MCIKTYRKDKCVAIDENNIKTDNNIFKLMNNVHIAKKYNNCEKIKT